MQHIKDKDPWPCTYITFTSCELYWKMFKQSAIDTLIVIRLTTEVTWCTEQSKPTPILISTATWTTHTTELPQTWYYATPLCGFTLMYGLCMSTSFLPFTKHFMLNLPQVHSRQIYFSAIQNPIPHPTPWRHALQRWIGVAEKTNKKLKYQCPVNHDGTVIDHS